MRPLIAACAAGTIILAAFLIVAGGNVLERQASAPQFGDPGAIVIDPIDPDDLPPEVSEIEPEPEPEIVPEPEPALPPRPSRRKPLETEQDQAGLERANRPDQADAQEKPLYRPVAATAGTITAMGYTVEIDNIEPVALTETCTIDGTQWQCGASARTALRSFLRGRAVTCNVPPEPSEQAVISSCSLGNQDVGEWLVANGWARAAAGGPYAEAGEEAQKAGRGVFGRPPAAIMLPNVSPLVVEEPAPQTGTGFFPPAPAPTPPTAPTAPSE